MNRPRIEPLGEDALLLRLGDAIDPQLNRRVHALAARIEAIRPSWLREVVPAYASLAAFVDVDAMAGADRDPLDEAADWLRALAGVDGSTDAAGPDAAPAEVPVCYASGFAPDLDDLARHADLSPAEVVARHCAVEYTVAMIGFAPGFPYLLGLDPALAMPRLASPRTRVPAGSVAVGGAQTGIYPREGPGGWRIIGRTPSVLFDSARSAPCLLAPGQRVRFVAIDADAFERLSRRRP